MIFGAEGSWIKGFYIMGLFLGVGRAVTEDFTRAGDNLPTGYFCKGELNKGALYLGTIFAFEETWKRGLLKLERTGKG